MYGRRVIRFKIHKLLNIFLVAHGKNKFKIMLSFKILLVERNSRFIAANAIQ